MDASEDGQGCAAVIFSIGYEGRSGDELVRVLQTMGVQTLVDVRLNPQSRKPGLSKTPLREALQAVGIEYVHEPLLGNPKENRAGFHTGDLHRARERYRSRLANGSRDALLGLAALASERKAAVLCFERDEDHCHRQVIVEELQEVNPGLVAVPLT